MERWIWLMDSEFFSMVYRPVLIIGIAFSVIIAVTAVVTAFSAGGSDDA